MPPSRVRIPPSPLRLARTDKGKSRSLTVERVRPGNFTPAPLRMTRKPATEAERAGFEPATHLSARTRFPVALLRPLGHLSVLRSGEGGIRTLDGGIHPHNALAGRRLQPLGHFSASLRRIADPDSRIPLRGEESTPGSTKMSLPAPPSYPRQSETRLRLPEAGFAFQGTTTP